MEWGWGDGSRATREESTRVVELVQQGGRLLSSPITRTVKFARNVVYSAR